jgi:hypothetical protein
MARTTLASWSFRTTGSCRRASSRQRFMLRLTSLSRPALVTRRLISKSYCFVT